MTRAEAQAQSAKLNAEHPDRANNHWRVRVLDDGRFDVVRISLSLNPPDATKTEQRAEARPTADDPRPSFDRNVGGPWAPGL